MKPTPHFDLKQHIRELNRFVMPLFFVLCAIVMLIFIAIRTGDHGPKLQSEGFTPARIGLLNSVDGPLFDPAFAVLSPIELVLAPTSSTFDFPAGSEHGALAYDPPPSQNSSDTGDPVYAVSDGKVIYAGRISEESGNVVVLLHELADGRLVESVYGHLEMVHVPVGGQVRRGGKLGTTGLTKEHSHGRLQFELRTSLGFDPGPFNNVTRQGNLDGEATLVDWRSRRDDQLAAAPAGEPIEPSALSLDVDDTME